MELSKDISRTIEESPNRDTIRDVVSSVRRQSFWDSFATELKECRAHPFGFRLLLRSEVCGVQQWSFV